MTRHLRPLALRRAFLALGVAAALSPTPGAVAEPGRPALRVELRAMVELPGGAIRLGDVAEVSGGAAAQAERLRTVVLGRLGGDGPDRRVVARGALARWLRLREGIAPAAIAWGGAERCEVRLETQAVSGARIAEAAAERALASLRERGLAAEVRAVRVPDTLRLPPGEVRLAVRELPRLLAVARRAAVWVDVEVDGRRLRGAPVLLELTVRGRAAVARERLAAGTRLSPALLEEREVAWSGRTAEPLGLAAAAGTRLRRAVEKGDPVTGAVAVAAPLVSRGGRATLRARDGAVEVEGRVEVLQDGFSGQAVPVRVPGALGPILARVVGPDAVELP